MGLIDLVVNQRVSGEFDVYVGRPSKWGNPITLRSERDRADVILGYIQYLSEHPELIEEARHELRGKRLGCWCAPKLCHGHILALIANT